MELKMSLVPSFWNYSVGVSVYSKRLLKEEYKHFGTRRARLEKIRFSKMETLKFKIQE